MHFISEFTFPHWWRTRLCKTASFSLERFHTQMNPGGHMISESERFLFFSADFPHQTKSAVSSAYFSALKSPQ